MQQNDHARPSAPSAIANAAEILERLEKLRDEINVMPVEAANAVAIVAKIRSMKCEGHPDHAFLKNFYCDVLNLINRASDIGKALAA